MDVIELGALPQDEARKLLSSGVPVYLMVNPIEYHGPHLPLGNDHNLSLAAIRDLHQRLREDHPSWPLLLAPPLHVGVDPAPGNGSVPVPFPTVRNLVLNGCRALESLGARRVVLMTFHGHPMHNMALDAGVRYLRSRGLGAIAPFNLVLHELLDYQPGKFDDALAPVEDPLLRTLMRKQLPCDFHAGFFETSLVLHYLPETVAHSYRELPPCPPIHPNALFTFLAGLAERLGKPKLAAECRFVAMGLGWLKLKPYPGYSGWPHVASAASGKAFAEAIMRLFVPRVKAAFEGAKDSPQPILRWLAPLSLNGGLSP